LEVKVKNATQLSPLFSHLNLSDDAAIWLFTENKKMAMGPITSKNIPQKLAKITPDFLPGESITIAYFVDDERPLTIQGFNIGYQSKSRAKKPNSGFFAAGSCNIDISDPAADCFKFEQNAVALLLNDTDISTTECTGSLINSKLNSNQHIRPFLLSANHCFTNNGITPNSMRVRFKWHTGINIRSEFTWNWSFSNIFEGYITFIGATLHATSRHKADFALLELFNAPVGNQFTYLGWDKTSVTPQNITFLHHPKGDFMKITHDADAPVQTTTANGVLVGDKGWLCTLKSSPDDFGAAQNASSGSAWLNQNHQVSGVHSFADQDPTEFTTCFKTANPKYGAGRFDVSVKGEDRLGTRLSDWIDPNDEVSTLVGNFKLDAPNYISCGNVGLNVSAPHLKTSDGTPYTYRWTESPNLEISGSGHEVVVSAKSPMSSSSLGFIECVIIAPDKCEVNGNEVIVGKARHQFTLAANLSVRNMNNNSESTVSFLPLNRTFTFRPFIEGAGSDVTFSWLVSGANGVAHFFGGQDFLDINFFNRGSVSVSLTAQFGGCSITKNFVLVGGGFAPQKQNVDLEATQIYPNPVTVQDIVVELPREMDLQHPVWIQLKDIHGKTVRTLESKEHNILLNIQNVPNGIYMVLIQTGETSITKKLTIQH
jgi:hypothetical protein